MTAVEKKTDVTPTTEPTPTAPPADVLKDPLLAASLHARELGDGVLTGDLAGILVERAGHELGDDATLFSLSGEAPPTSDGRFDFPEGPEQADPLPKLREKHEGSASWIDHDKSKASVKGAGDAHEIDPHDVAQGALGDCYLIASLAAVARANPDQLKGLIHTKDDGQFEVSLYVRDSYYAPPRKITKTIDARLPSKEMNKLVYAKGTDKDEAGNQELWPALVEKALAQVTGDYEQISGGNIGKSMKFAGALELLTGKPESFLKTDGMSPDDAVLEIGAALEGGKPVTVDSRDMSGDPALAKEAEALNVYGNHAYAPESVDLDAMTMDLQNPWGSDHVDDLSARDFLKYYRAIRIGS